MKILVDYILLYKDTISVKGKLGLAWNNLEISWKLFLPADILNSLLEAESHLIGMTLGPSTTSLPVAPTVLETSPRGPQHHGPMAGGPTPVHVFSFIK